MLSKEQIKLQIDMKKLVMTIFVMAGISAMAQDQNMEGNRGSMNNLTPEQIATLQTKKMTLALDLNDSQQVKIKAMLIQDAGTRKTKMQENKAFRKEGEKMTADEKFAMQNERLDHRIELKKEMKSILTEEQYSKWEKMKHKNRMHRTIKKRDGRRNEMGPKKD